MLLVSLISYAIFSPSLLSISSGKSEIPGAQGNPSGEVSITFSFLKIARHFVSDCLGRWDEGVTFMETWLSWNLLKEYLLSIYLHARHCSRLLQHIIGWQTKIRGTYILDSASSVAFIQTVCVCVCVCVCVWCVCSVLGALWFYIAGYTEMTSLSQSWREGIGFTPQSLVNLKCVFTALWS